MLQKHIASQDQTIWWAKMTDGTDSQIPVGALNPTHRAADFEPIPPNEAQQRLEQAIVARLGADWDSEDSGWLIVDRTAYQARLTKGKVNLDFYVDLLGEVRIEEKPTTLVQESGRWIAWLLLALSVAIALTIAQIVQSIS